jgi:hypothetical protein
VNLPSVVDIAVADAVHSGGRQCPGSDGVYGKGSLSARRFVHAPHALQTGTLSGRMLVGLRMTKLVLVVERGVELGMHVPWNGFVGVGDPDAVSDRQPRGDAKVFVRNRDDVPAVGISVINLLVVPQLPGIGGARIGGVADSC